MLRRFRERCGSAGLIVGVIALVLAVAGGAFAAGGGLSSKQKKEVEKIAKKAAKPGKPGAPGSPGANGKDGAIGPEGKQGPQGNPGSAGKSVKVTPIAAELDPRCKKLGGSEVKEEGSATGVEVCNGAEGPEGQPWTPNNTLPAGAAETGTWFFQAGSGSAYAPISLPIELSGKLKWAALDSSENKVHYETESNFGDFDGPGGEALGCTGSSQLPIAPPGHLCAYVSNVENATFEEAVTTALNPGFLRPGGLLKFAVTPGGIGGGSFAVKSGCGAGEEVVEVPENPGVSPIEFICEESA
jgi:hypothetical protein